MKEILDIPYKKVDGITLYLDLFLPHEAVSSPLILWIHGGAWNMGDRKWCGLLNQVERGYAVASIDYRLSTMAPFPACIEDCKSALAFLRENAQHYPIDISRICVAGDSAGGHLAALMGVSAGHVDWEPEGADCSVQAVIDFFGPTFIELEQEEQDNEVVNQLLGVPVTTPKGMMLGAAASPITYIDGKEPPFLIMHGDKDDIIPIEQSYVLRNKLEENGRSVFLYTVQGAGHGFENNPVIETITNNFLDFIFFPLDT